MAPDALERAVLGFALGEGHVLLATNVIEAGLDIARQPDRDEGRGAARSGPAPSVARSGRTQRAGRRIS